MDSNVKPSDHLHIIGERDVGLFSLVQQVISGHVWTPPSVQEESFGLLGA
jgi:hypothetical protein